MEGKLLKWLPTAPMAEKTNTKHLGEVALDYTSKIKAPRDMLHILCCPLAHNITKQPNHQRPSTQNLIQCINSSMQHLPDEELNLLENFHLPNRGKNRPPHPPGARRLDKHWKKELQEKPFKGQGFQWPKSLLPSPKQKKKRKETRPETFNISLLINER